MHSMHHLRAHDESSGHVQQQPEQSIGGPIRENHHANTSMEQDQQAASMTVLVQLDAAQPTNQVAEQPILSGLEPVQQQPLGNRAMRSASNQQAPIIHHMSQQQHHEQLQRHQQLQPQLHVLRAPSMAKPDQQDQPEHLSEQHTQQAHSSRTIATRQLQQDEGGTAETQEMVNRWLLDNYEIADGESLPRSTVYNHYISYCRHLRTTPQNAASFGKQIRSVFVGLKTRRLGTRGHSKYHYFGIRAKNHVNLEWLQASEHLANSQDSHRRRVAGCSSRMRDPSQENSNTDQGSESDSTNNHTGRLSSLGGSMSNNTTSNGSKRPIRLHDAPELAAYAQPMDSRDHYDETIDSNQHYVPSGVYYSNAYSNKEDRGWPLDQTDLSSLRQHLGANSESLVDRSWPHREQGVLESRLSESLPSQPTCDETGIPIDFASLVQVFEGQYKSYYKRMIDLLSKCQFSDVGRLLSEFWHPPAEAEKHEATNEWPSNDSANTNGNQYHHQTMDPSQHLAQQQQHIQHEQHHLVYGHQDQRMMISSAEVSLSFNQLYQLTSLTPMIERINEIDRKLFTAIETFLVPDLLSPIPRALIHHIRLFARDFGVWMESLIKDYPQAFVVEKLKSSRAFEHALNRYTSINHLASSSYAIWTRRSVLTQMSMDLNRIDLRDIEHQVSLMSQAKYDQLLGSDGQRNELPSNGHLGQQHQQAIVDHNRSSNHHTHNDHSNNNHPNNTTNQHQVVHDDSENNYLNTNGNHIYSNQTNQSPIQSVGAAMQPAQLIQHFIHLLDDPYPANIWPDWCRNLVESRVRGQSLEEARNFILKWNFYVSLIMRELTLRSAPSLGSFQLIRLLFDEYMYYLVVMKLAQVQHKTSIQLMTSSMKFDDMH